MDSNSILDTVKSSLLILPEYTVFDEAIITCINTTLSLLNQIGLDNNVYVTDSSTTWDELLTNDDQLAMVKTYICNKVKLMFDPPASGTIKESYEKVTQEIEWRISIACEQKVN